MAEYDVIADAAGLGEASALLAAGTGPVAVDVERASGFRYSQRAYLVQVFRRGAGAFLFDPPAIGDMTALQRAIGGEEWILHAASQDLPSLRELHLDPPSIFDTELAARLLGHERVGLGAVVEDTLGITLAKAHSAADWSTRPLPQPWLEYAALDVMHLVDVYDELVLELLREQEIGALQHRGPHRSLDRARHHEGRDRRQRLAVGVAKSALHRLEARHQILGIVVGVEGRHGQTPGLCPFAEGVQEGPDDRPVAGQATGVARQDLGHDLLERILFLTCQGGDDRLLVGEVAIQRTDADPGPLGQRIGVEAIFADAFQKLSRSLKNDLYSCARSHLGWYFPRVFNALHAKARDRSSLRQPE